MQSSAQVDVIISGGGLSGLLTALGLQQEAPELSIAIVEPFHQQNSLTDKNNFDDRCLALSYGSIQLFNHWKLWQQLKSRCWPIQTIVTSDRGHLGKTLMRSSEYRVNAMGYVASMKNLGSVFKQQLSERNLQWFCPDKITDVEQTASQVAVSLNSGQQLTGKLLVVAEGGESPTRDKLKISMPSDQYSQMAVIANVEVSRTHKQQRQITNADITTTAFERFTTSGPIAFLPISDNQYSIVWSIKPEQQQDVLALNDEEFCQQLQQEFGFSAGTIIKTSERYVYPLALAKAQQLFNGRAVLIGNCAHTVHPIAGQGFNLGLRDVAQLVELISSAHNSGLDIGDYSVMSAYQKNRQQDINRVTNFTDFLVRIFALEGRLAAFTRTVGLAGLQKFSSLKQWLSLQFMSSNPKYLNSKD